MQEAGQGRQEVSLTKSRPLSQTKTKLRGIGRGGKDIHLGEIIRLWPGSAGKGAGKPGHSWS